MISQQVASLFHPLSLRFFRLILQCMEYKDHNQADFYVYAWYTRISSFLLSTHTHIIYSTLYFLRLSSLFHSLPLLPFHRFVYVYMPFLLYDLDHIRYEIFYIFLILKWYQKELFPSKWPSNPLVKHTTKVSALENFSHISNTLSKFVWLFIV